MRLTDWNPPVQQIWLRRGEFHGGEYPAKRHPWNSRRRADAPSEFSMKFAGGFPGGHFPGDGCREIRMVSRGGDPGNMVSPSGLGRLGPFGLHPTWCFLSQFESICMFTCSFFVRICMLLFKRYVVRAGCYIPKIHCPR